jgi:hypothetical protein
MVRRIDTFRRGMRSYVVSDPGIARDRALRDRLYRHIQQYIARLAGSLQSSQASLTVVRTVGMLRHHGDKRQQLCAAVYLYRI